MTEYKEFTCWNRIYDKFEPCDNQCDSCKLEDYIKENE